MNMNTLMQSPCATAQFSSIDRNQLEETAYLPRFAQEVMEGWLDGVLVLTQQGAIVYSNSYARQMCQQLMPSSRLDGIPTQVWRICKALMDSQTVFPAHRVVLDDDITTKTLHIRIRTRWLERPDRHQPYLLVTLEDRFQSLQNVATSEARKYNLTPRESEVWLLRRANRTYKSIAAELHIAIDTVKKHIKSIHAKRDASQWAED
ncbi:MAG: helix-turn-helix transcriptional regulator [Leptolyngbyaceae cyanobacterium SL_7_1]|nr:helix-turn-helix transcriptional regulator [Leptolyngbyaceae cyanobacterium SL_7_1]